MAVDKIMQIEYDLSSLNQDQANKLIKANEEIIKKAQDQQKKKPKPKKVKQEVKTTPDKKKKKKEKKVTTKELAEEFPLESFTGGTKGIDLFVSQFKTAIPFITLILLASGFFISKLLNLSKLNKKFIDIADDRISVFITRQQQALLESRQAQVIYTISPGSAAPRDSYNSFNNFDDSITQNGIERDASSFGGVD